LNNLLIKTFSIFSILLCAACSTNSGTATFKPATAKADQAVIYIYRPSVMSNALYSPGINVDGEFKLYAKSGINSQLMLKPGEHTFEFQADKRYADLSRITLSLEAGSTTYLRVDTSLKIEDSVGYEPYARSFVLTHAAEETAIKEIAECCTAKPEQLEEKNKTATVDESGDGFSVDKTQNPFSH
jgi:hypothetical protein